MCSSLPCPVFDDFNPLLFPSCGRLCSCSSPNSSVGGTCPASDLPQMDPPSTPHDLQTTDPPLWLLGPRGAQPPVPPAPQPSAPVCYGRMGVFCGPRAAFTDTPTGSRGTRKLCAIQALFLLAAFGLETSGAEPLVGMLPAALNPPPRVPASATRSSLLCAHPFQNEQRKPRPPTVGQQEQDRGPQALTVPRAPSR